MTHRTRCAPVLAAIVVLPLVVLGADTPSPRLLGGFEDHGDVGTVSVRGTVEYDGATKRYRVTAGGENIWGKRDAFHFVWRKVSGDFSISAEVRLVGEGKDAHRKACLMARQGLEPGAAYADVAVHGDGLVSLQFRKEKDGVTQEVQAKAKAKPGAPVAVRLQRRGDVFTLWVSSDGQAPEKAAEASVPLRDPLLLGLALSAHDAAASETAEFDHVVFE